METMRYSLQDFTNIMFNGFEFKLPSETVTLIAGLEREVGSPTYIKTPNFSKKDNQMEYGSVSGYTGSSQNYKKRGRVNKIMELGGSDDWESIRSFQPTKIEHKTGIDGKIDELRLILNKMSDKNAPDSVSKICDIIDECLTSEVSPEEMYRIGNTVFVIASNNRFYSKLYADLFSKLIDKYEIMATVFENNFNEFIKLFDTIEHGDADKDYDNFCKVNKQNENRKALSMFLVNLMKNGIISADKIVTIVYDLFCKLDMFILEENKKDEVDEITENIAIIYSKELIQTFQTTNQMIGDKTSDDVGTIIFDRIQKFATSKAKTFPSLSNKSIFKFMDIRD